LALSRHLFGRLTPLWGGLLIVPILLVLHARGSLGEVAELFRATRYDAARETLAGEPEGDDPGARQLWQQRLAEDPDEAYDLALDLVRDRSQPQERRLQAALDAAAISLTRQRPEAAWQVLAPLLELMPESLPGEAYLLAGRTQRLVGNRQRAREMLASVRPDDPAFVAARNLLGRIGLEAGDNELALRYFESAARHGDAQAGPELLAGRWQALRLLGRDVEARETAERLRRNHPTSLAALEVGELLRQEAEELSLLADTTAVNAPEVLAVNVSGRYAVQLAAFRDRALALQFVARWQPEIPELRIERQLDELDQPLYKVQVGSFVSRAQARTEVTRIEHAHGLQGFVVGSGD
jgi:hypothetical protein